LLELVYYAMSLISATNLAKSYDPVDIFSGITLGIPRGARIAIVGPNGIGKTTLLRILVGEEEPSAGRVHRARGLRLGYLPQEAGLTGPHTLWEECLRALEDLRQMEAELAGLEAAMGDPQRAEEALARYGPLQLEYERRGGYTYETRIRQTLTGLGFDPSDYKRPLTQLSGGQRTRTLLARLLLAGPDLLILDEPTNHLDIAAVEWLESYLSQWEGAALIVSHDRYFLDKVTDHIWEMGRSGLEVYRGNYSAYLQQRQERWEQRQQVYTAEKERLEKELDYIKRNISGQNVLQAKGRLRRVSRYLDAIEKGGLQAIQGKKWAEISDELGVTSQMMSVEEVERRIHGLREPSARPPGLRLNLKTRLRSGDLVLRTYNLEIGYVDEGRPLFRAPDLVLRRGECAALIGPNGAGKTTFLKTLLQRTQPLSGEVALGASLDIAYFAQAHEDLHPERTLVEEIDAVAPHMLLAEIRHYLARFLFTGEDVFKKVEVLSGGERGRLALAKLTLSNANLLLLDEPTNHLDIPSQETLQEVLAEYQGTILLVSHDRYLIDALATQIWEIEPDQAAMRWFEGTYSQYRQQREAEKAAAAEARSREPAHDQKPRPAALSPDARKRRARLKQVEELIGGLEEQLNSLSHKLENPPADPAKVQKLGQEYVRIQAELDQLLQEWEGLHEPA
jgi:ATP-binding cassette subfamily F protein 3